MRKALAFSLALLSSTLFAADDLPDEGTATDPDKQAEVPSESTAPNQMSEKQQLNDCLLRSAQTADNAVTAKEMRNWCTNGDEVKKRSVHEDALRARLALENTTQGNPFVITPHRRNYLMPYSYWSNRKWNDPTKDDSALDHTEVKFQLSLKAPIKENIVDDVTLWMAFTGTFFWQAYNKEESAPFREANYEPEIFITKPVNWQFGPVDSELLALGIVHESNGQDVPVSRSWNRIFINYVAKTGDYYWSLKPWYRLPEDKKDDPTDPRGDDNPDIEKYMGNFELEVARPFGNHVVEIMVRNNLRSDNKGAGRLNYSFPLSKRFKGLVQVFSGYGDSLINYDNYENRFSVGILLTDSL
ncbi:MAG: phospholipase [Alcanivoracaceae bacterium]|nr:phospholipase [Alcanivoracaceae bacterium]MCG8439493.1 phospholipase A [Pseudomonadales bacterium]MED5432450.1 phospholipase A [Pseudomonadota bacterium]MEE2869852.1 phospholipase A [Pseudomonadota bacterium]|tara:strand:+ start:419 stop:1489 length:1071 start_codon:yes stop_codon:yes gene_type:complete